MKHWNRYLDTALYGLVLLCVVVVSLAFWPPSHRPFETVKGLLFHSFALMACFLVLARAFHTKTLPFPRDLLSGLVCLYLGYNLLSFALSPFADRSYFLDLVFLIVFFFSASAAVDSVGRYGGLLYAVALLVLISTIYAILQSFGIDYQPFLNRFGERALGSRIFSFFGNPNFFAAVLAVNLPLLLAGFFTNTGRGKALFGTSLAGAVLGLLLSASRAALLGSMVAVVLFFGLTLGRSGRKRYLWLVSTTAALLIGGFIFTASVKETGIGRLEIRQLWWDSALRIASDHPLFGTGVGSFNVYYPAYRDKSTEIALGEGRHEIRVSHPHNEFLEILSDLGIVGLLLFAAILVTFFYNHYAGWDSRKKYLIAGSSCAVVAILTHNLFSVNLRYVFIAMFLWLTLASQSGLLGKRVAVREVNLSNRRLMASFLLLPLLAGFFLSYSWARFRVDQYFYKASHYFKSQQHQEAATNFEEALRVDPQHKWSLYYLGISHYRLKRYDESKATLGKLMELDPHFLQSHYWLANNHLRTQDLEGAKKEYRESLRVNDAYGPAYFALGLISEIEHDIPSSLEYFRKAGDLQGDLSTRNTRIMALQKLIEHHQDRGDLEQAKNFSEKLRELEEKTRGRTRGS